jgi:hypothetical protein
LIDHNGSAGHNDNDVTRKSDGPFVGARPLPADLAPRAGDIRSSQESLSLFGDLVKQARTPSLLYAERVIAAAWGGDRTTAV